MKVMRAPKDLLSDIPLDSLIQGAKSNSTINMLREKHGLGRTPQLIVYNITGEVKTQNHSDNGEKKLQSTGEQIQNLIGLSMWIPSIDGDSTGNNYVKTLTVRIPDSVDFSVEE